MLFSIFDDETLCSPLSAPPIPRVPGVEGTYLLCTGIGLVGTRPIHWFRLVLGDTVYKEG